MRGNVIRFARQALGMTQAQLARKVNSTQLSVTKWETNTYTPTTENMRKLKTTLGIDEKTIAEIEELLRDEQHKKLAFRLRSKAGAKHDD